MVAESKAKVKDTENSKDQTVGKTPMRDDASSKSVNGHVGDDQQRSRIRSGG